VAKFAPDTVLDELPNRVATGTRQVVCSGQPANFAGIAAVALADVTMTAGSGNGDYTVGDGDTNGRKVRVEQQSAVPIDASGTATHISIDDGSTLLYVTTCTSQALTSGGTVTIPAWDIEIADPT
jgi:hypothetical protein